MINLAIALAGALAALLAFGFALGGGSFNVWAGILPALIVLVGAYVYLMRRTFKQVEVIMTRAQSKMAKFQEKAQEKMMRTRKQIPEKELHAQMESVVEILKEAYQYKQWQFLLEAQINAQVGTLYYAQKKFDEAEPYLRNSFYKNWMAQGMLGAIHYRRKEFDTMKEVFEKGVKANKKEGLLWTIYAWCLWKNDDTEGAIEVLSRAKEEVETDQRVMDNLLALQNGKKMNLDQEGWREIWYQFHLVKPKPMQVAAPGGAGGRYYMGGRPSKRSVYR